MALFPPNLRRWSPPLTGCPGRRLAGAVGAVCRLHGRHAGGGAGPGAATLLGLALPPRGRRVGDRRVQLQQPMQVRLEHELRHGAAGGRRQRDPVQSPRRAAAPSGGAQGPLLLQDTPAPGRSAGARAHQPPARPPLKGPLRLRVCPPHCRPLPRSPLGPPPQGADPRRPRRATLTSVPRLALAQLPLGGSI